MDFAMPEKVRAGQEPAGDGSVPSQRAVGAVRAWMDEIERHILGV